MKDAAHLEAAYSGVAGTLADVRDVASAAYSVAKCLVADGKRARISVEEEQDCVSLRQRRFFHGPVLGQIAAQVRIDGQRFTEDTWKEYFRARFLPDRWTMRVQPRWDEEACRIVVPKEPTPCRVKRSTESLGVKGYSRLIELVLAHAATELGVEFDLDPAERDAVRYQPPTRASQE
jgi:hypothetical protein